jgi:putative flippase GtrA
VFGNVTEFFMMPNLTKSLVAQFCSFVWVGGFATLLHYLVLIFLVQIGEVRPTFASGVGCIAGAGLSYLLNYHYTFVSKISHAPAVAKFFTVAAIGLAINLGIVALATEHLSVNYLIAQVFATGSVLLWSFTANRLWTFRPTLD